MPWVALAAAVTLLAAAPLAHADFGVARFKAQTLTSATEFDQAAPDFSLLDREAGSHPFIGVTDFTVNTDSLTGVPQGNVRNVRVDLPPGLISNPEATRDNTGASVKCTNLASCPPETKIGEVELHFPAPTPPLTASVYNMVPGPNQISDFAFDASSATGQVRTDIIGGVDPTDYHLFFTISDVPQVTNLVESILRFCGGPTVSPKDASASKCPNLAQPFITLPTYCGDPGPTKLTLESWDTPAKTAVAYDPPVTPIDAIDCDKVPFAPTISVTPGTTQHDEPTGVTVDLHVPQDQSLTGLASSHVKNTVVTLPPGLTINPASANTGGPNGLKACSDDQFGKGTANPISCPDASKVGTVEIDTPNLPGPLTGFVYLGQPQPDNLFRLFVEAHGYTLSVRLVGKVTPDPVTGQLTTTFANTPEVPFTDFILKFNGGPTATLANPLACGPATTSATVSPWTGQPDVAVTSTPFTVDADGKGGACPSPAPFSLGFSAGTTNPLAGAFSPFTLTVSRDDGQQYLSKLQVQQPPGLLGVIANVTPCDDANAAAGTCPDASKIGTSTVASGAGSAPFSITGPVYLTGPYNGAPFGLSIVVHAVAGPFDLGTVVVRAGIRVDSTDSHLTVDSDPLPTILQGIPLRLRTVTVTIDRDQFIFNPTNCSALAVGATLTAVDGTVQQVTSPFQATGCDGLPFAPTFAAASSAKTSVKNGASLAVALSQKRGESNTKSVSVTLPKALSARLTTLAQACPEATFKANPKLCPDGSQVGTATAATPLLTAPLGGTVYLEAHAGGQLPTLEVMLTGSGIAVDLSGTIVVGGNGIQSTFKNVPDVPITSFALNLPSGPHSALSASGDLCAAQLVIPTTIVSQSGKTIQQQTVLSVPDCPIKVVGAKVKGTKATITVRVPAPGQLKVAGKGLKPGASTVKAAAFPSTVKVSMKLTKKGLKALKAARKHHKKLSIRVTASFTPAKGAVAIPSTAARKLKFK